MSEDSLAIEGGLADPVLGAQSIFRAVMDALARPGTVHPLIGDIAPPQPLTRGLAAIALTLCDHDTRVWLDTTLMESAAVTAWLRFHTGAVLTTDPGEADFALVSGVDAMPALVRFALGSDEYPDQSTTIVLAVDDFADGPSLTLRGPGIKSAITAKVRGLAANFVPDWEMSHSLFPRGVDLLLVTANSVLGLPRTTRISLGDQ